VRRKATQDCGDNRSTTAPHTQRAPSLVAAPTAVADTDADAVRLLDAVGLPLAVTEPDAAAVALCSGGGSGKEQAGERWGLARVSGSAAQAEVCILLGVRVGQPASQIQGAPAYSLLMGSRYPSAAKDNIRGSGTRLGRAWLSH